SCVALRRAGTRCTKSTPRPCPARAPCIRTTWNRQVRWRGKEKLSLEPPCTLVAEGVRAVKSVGWVVLARGARFTQQSG
ncbi:MAG: hypothetical protein QMD09_10160, partial [Desulfatibacillaceae bacterium]|nr:hypothetical protein [Desulfatibacillaceae bacterium]